MINGVHALLSARDADAVRAFLRVARAQIPGGGSIAIYEPRHPTAIEGGVR